MSCTQWLTKLSHQVQGPYADIECKQVTGDLLGASRHIYSHQNTSCTTETRLKRRLCATPESSVIVERNQNYRLSLCCILKGSRSNGYRAGSPRCSKRLLTVRADTGRSANMAISVMWLYGFAGPIAKYVSTVNYGRELRFCKLFSMTLSNPLIPHSHNSGWISNSATNDNTHSR